jgi:adenylate cyclase
MPAAAPTALRGTVAFTDIVGFTEYTALRGDTEALTLLSEQERIVRDELPEGARIVKELGDGLLLWFPDACEALRTMLRLQERFEEETERHELPLWVRMGMHYGRPSTRGEDLIGHDVNIAARVVDVAAPGELLVSDACLSAMNEDMPDVAFEELGPVVMKGLPEPVRLYRALRGGVEELARSALVPAST